MNTKAVPGTTLDRISEQNEYKAAFIEVMECLEESKSALPLPLPLRNELIGLWVKTKGEKEERLKGSFEHYLSNFPEEDQPLLKQIIQEWFE